jgi:protein phosphatase
MMDSYGFTDPGCIRTDNQDRLLIDLELGFYVVADGMGGHRHGELAAELAISTMRYYLQSSHDRSDITWPFGYDFQMSIDSNRLATAVRLANRHVWKRAEEGPEYAGMGTTIAAALLHGGGAAIGNVGDSRVYLFRNRQLEQLTTDDTWINAVLRRGGVNVDAVGHPMRNVLTQAAGSQNEVNVHIEEVPVESGDLLMISSDGLHGVVRAATLCEVLCAGGALDWMGNQLLEAARTEGAPDNIACILIRIE